MRKKIRKYLLPHKGNNYKPHLLRELSVAILIASILLVLAGSFAATDLIRNSDLLSAIYPAVLVDMANQSRIADNETPLTVNPLLEAAAGLKAEDMASKGYFAHNSPEGKTPWYWFGQAGYNFVYAGENLAINFNESKDVHDAWLNSPGHRANILGIHFTQVGIAVRSGQYQGRPTLYIVQMFGSPAEARVLSAATQVSPQKLVVLESASTSKNTSLAIVQNTTITSELKQSVAGAAVAAATSSVPIYSTPTQRLLLNPSRIGLYFFYFLGTLIIITLILILITGSHALNRKNIVYGLILLIILIIAVYISRTLLI